MTTVAASGATFISGQVINATTNKPIADAEVALEEFTFRTVSGADGTFSFEIPRGFLSPGQYLLSAGHEGFKQSRATIFFFDGRSVGQDFLLEPNS